MPNQIPEPLKHERSALLIKKQASIKHDILENVIKMNPVTEILPETYDGQFAYGHTASFIEVAVASDEPLHSGIFEVEPIERNGEILIGRICK